MKNKTAERLKNTVMLNLFMHERVKKHCHSELDSESMYVRSTQLKKLAAMFGLDARIALAIFGALSVITGAALYSALNSIEAIAIISDSKEIQKALEAYILDTGKGLKIHTSYSNGKNVRNHDLIVNPGIRGWKGPYIALTKQDSDLTLNNGEYYNKFFKIDTNSNWSSSASASKCVSSENCYYVLEYSLLNGRQTKALDKKLDKSDGGDKGTFRYSQAGVPPIPNTYYGYFITDIPGFDM